VKKRTENGARGTQSSDKGQASLKDFGNVPVILGFRPLHDHFQFCGQPIQERCDPDKTIIGRGRLSNTPRLYTSK